MAFSATIRNVQYMGPGLTRLTGDWTGTYGDAAGTMSVAGTVVKANFYIFQNDQTWQIIPRVFSSTTNGITTLTINNQDDASSGGFFEIEKLGG